VNYYYNGTSAYKLDEYERFSKKQSEKQVARKSHNRELSVAFCRFLAVGVAALFVMASALIYFNVMMLRAASQVESLKDELALITEANTQKEMKISQKLDFKTIEDKAINELGMQRPDNSQIVYLGVQQTSYSEIAETSPAANAVSDTVKDTWEGFVEYFTK